MHLSRNTISNLNPWFCICKRLIRSLHCLSETWWIDLKFFKGESEKCSRSKVATQLLIVEKHQYNFSCSLHLYIKQNETFLIANLSNVNTKSCLRNQTPLCIHLLVVLVPSHRHVVFWGSLFPLITDNWLKLFKLNCLQFR